MKENNLNHMTVTAQAFVLGRLGGIGNKNLGNANGIPSSLANATSEELTEYAAKLGDAITRITDASHICCIDGRFRICNCDGSLPEVRAAHIGGTLTLPAIAMTAGLKVVEQGASWHEAMTRLEALLGLDSSSHTGGCGGARGLVKHQQTVHDNPDVMTATQAVMNHDALVRLTNVTYDDDIARDVQKRAGGTARQLQADEWNGDEQVQRAIKLSPHGVEDLKADDTKSHNGHEEPAVLAVYSISGENTLSVNELQQLGLGRPFIVNLNFIIDAARKLTGAESGPDVTAFVIADIANHVAGASDLASPETPIILVIIP